MVEAGCLEWAAVAAIVLRDAMAIIRIVNAARSAPDAPRVVQRLYEGFIQLDNYAQHTCLGYRAFMTSIQPQVRSLAVFISAASPVSTLTGSGGVHTFGNGPSPKGAQSRMSPEQATGSSPAVRPSLPRSQSDPLGVRLGAAPRQLAAISSSEVYQQEMDALGREQEEEEGGLQQQQSSCSIS
jgi:hypothetical protein